MKKHEDKNEVREDYTKSDFDRMRAGLAEVSPDKNRFGSRFFKFLEKENVIRIEDGELVRSPQLYTKYANMMTSIEKWDMAEEDRLFQQFPEQKEEAMAKRRKFMKELRQSLAEVGLVKRVTE